MKQRLPLCGNFIPFSRSPLHYVHSCYQKVRRGSPAAGRRRFAHMLSLLCQYGSCFTLPIFHRKLTFVLGPGTHDIFFKARDSEVNQQQVYNFMKPVFGAGVVYDAPVKMFQQQLRFMSRGLKSDALKTYVPKIVAEAQQYFGSSKFGKSGQFDLMPTISELIIMTASSCLMGREVREHLHTQVADLYRLLDEGITPLSFFFPNAPIPQHLKRNKARKEMVALFKRVVEQRRAKAAAATTESADTDILRVFMDAKYRDGRGLTAEEIAGLMIALLFAGQHTSTITTTWTLLLLLNHPEELEKVMQEQRELLGEDLSAPLDWDNINKMDRLHNAVKEAVRMYPPLIFLMRHVTKPLKVNDYTIPAGHTLVASGALSMRLPEAFTNPDKFDPDRFGPGRREDDAKEYAWVGFGGGFHACTCVCAVQCVCLVVPFANRALWTVQAWARTSHTCR